VIPLLAGVALGWLLRDIMAGPVAQTPAPTAQAVATVAPSVAAPVAPTNTTLATATASAKPSTTTPTHAPATPTAAPPTSTSVPPLTSTPPGATATREPPTAVPATSTSAPTPTATQAADYIGHIVAEGETLETIAEAAGSTAEAIAQYNLLDGQPPVGRALIIPKLPGRTATLESAPLLISKGRADHSWVALTLDAGAGAEPVTRMLVALRERNIQITFFLTGKWIAENPELTRAIVADGHEIANHTYNHPDLTRIGAAAMRAELEDTEALLQQTAGASSRPLFRPPYGAYDEQVLQTAVADGYLPIYWTLDSLDSVGEPKTPEFLLERITGKLTHEQLRGAIILAHCGSAPTADALPKILDRFKEMGFEVKKVSEVLGR
jgi:peptidoglycan/xylan/chitin deacetylase (PgdA/CDA1 family)